MRIVSPFLRTARVRILAAALLGACAALNAQTPAPYVFTTVAGSSAIGSADGPGASARFYDPVGIARDAAGNLFVADNANHVIRRIAPDGTVTTLAGRAGEAGSVDGPGADARFRNPWGVVVEPSGSLVISDSGNNTLRRVTTAGAVTTIAGSPIEAGGANGPAAQARFNRPAGLAIDTAGNIYIADQGSATIRRLSASGEVTAYAGVAGGPLGEPIDGPAASARFGYVDQIALDGAGNLYAPDPIYRIVRRVSADGQVTTIAGTPSRFQEPAEHVDGVGGQARFGSPAGVSTDAAGNIYVSDLRFATIRKITPDFTVSTIAGVPEALGFADGAVGEARLSEPGALLSDATGNLVFTDSHAVRQLSGDQVRTIAGLTALASAGTSDGVGAAARFTQPMGVAVGPGNSLVVADTFNHTIRRVAADGTVTTIAGSPGESGAVDGVGTAARFFRPADVAVDSAGVVFVSDSANATVRRIETNGTVSTLAGTPGNFGDAIDATGAAARFRNPNGLAVQNGDVLLADGKNIRRITPQGVVTSIPAFFNAADPHTTYTDVAVGADGAIYAADPTYQRIVVLRGSTIESQHLPTYAPFRLAVHNDGRVVFTSTPSSGASTVISVRNVDGTIASIGGANQDPAYRDGLGDRARFMEPRGIAIDDTDRVFVTDASLQANTVRRGEPARRSVITAQPQSRQVATGASVSFTVEATALPAPTYQWRRNGTPIAGATQSSYNIAAVAAADAGDYSVVVTNDLGSVTSAAAALTLASSNPSTPAPTPSASGGGGAPSLWASLGLAALMFARWRQRH